MGTYYPNNVSSRKELISELLEPRNEFYQLDRHCVRGNVIWSVWTPTQKGIEKGIDPFIACDLMIPYTHDGYTEWGYKPMSEACGPFYYSCPLSYLDRAPVSDPEWRDEVKQYHQKRKAKRKKLVS